MEQVATELVERSDTLARMLGRDYGIDSRQVKALRLAVAEKLWELEQKIGG